MTRVTFDLDDTTLARIENIASERQISVQDLLRRHAEDLARLAPIGIQNRSHQDILSALLLPPGGEARATAEAYVANRQALLDLIDNTEGDMGTKAWDRQSVYER